MVSIRNASATLTLAAMLTACGGGGGGGGGSGGSAFSAGPDAFTKAVQAAVAVQNPDSTDPQDVSQWPVVKSETADPVAVL